MRIRLSAPPNASGAPTRAAGGPWGRCQVADSHDLYASHGGPHSPFALSGGSEPDSVTPNPRPMPSLTPSQRPSHATPSGYPEVQPQPQTAYRLPLPTPPPPPPTSHGVNSITQQASGLTSSQILSIQYEEGGSRTGPPRAGEGFAAHPRRSEGGREAGPASSLQGRNLHSQFVTPEHPGSSALRHSLESSATAYSVAGSQRSSSYPDPGHPSWCARALRASPPA